MHHIYCIFNKVYNYYGPDVWKLGRSNDAELRTTTSSTFAIDIYEVIEKIEVIDSIKAERLLFQILDIYRITDSREFFKVSLEIVKGTMDIVQNIINNNLDYTAPEEINYFNTPNISQEQYNQLKTLTYPNKLEKYSIKKYEYLHLEAHYPLKINKGPDSILSRFKLSTPIEEKANPLLGKLQNITESSLCHDKFLLYQKFGIDLATNFDEIWHRHGYIIDNLLNAEKKHYLQLVLKVFGFTDLYDTKVIVRDIDSVIDKNMKETGLLDKANYVMLMKCFKKKIQSTHNDVFSVKKYRDLTNMILNDYGFSLESKRKAARRGDKKFNVTYYNLGEKIEGIRDFLSKIDI